MQRIVAAACVMLTFAGPDGHVVVTTDQAGPYGRGAQVRVTVELAEPAHLVLVRVDTDGRAGVVLPGQPWDDSTSAGTIAASFAADERDGIGYLLAIAGAEPFDAAELSAGGHWDLRHLDEGRVRGDPYVALSRFASRVAPGRYDYDIVPYHVGRRYDYPRFACYECHDATAPDWDPYDRACARFGLVVYDDPANYPYRHYDRRAVVPERPESLAPRYEFRERGTGSPAIVNRRRAAAEAAPVGLPARAPRERGDSGSAEPPRRPRSLGEPELRRRPRPRE